MVLSNRDKAFDHASEILRSIAWRHNIALKIEDISDKGVTKGFFVIPWLDNKAVVGIAVMFNDSKLTYNLWNASNGDGLFNVNAESIKSIIEFFLDREKALSIFNKLKEKY